MANQPVPYHEGYWYHVHPKSRDDVPLFKSESEREWFVEKLDETLSRRQVGLGALCLMETHYHVIVRMGPVGLDRVFQGVHASYARYVNETRGRGGSLFEVQHDTDLVLDDEYFLQLIPYVHNRPIDAGIVDDALEYEWSTDSLYRIGQWLHGTLNSWTWPPKFQDEDRGRIYRELMNETVKPPPRETGFVGTREEFENLMRSDEDRSPEDTTRRSLETIAREVAERENTTVEALIQPGRIQPEARIRQQAMVEMYGAGYGPKEIADFFNRNKGTVVYAVQKSDRDDV